MSPSSIVSSGNSSKTFLTMGIKVAKWNGSAIACASVSPLNVKRLAEASSPSLTIGENELLKRVDCISFAIPSSLFRTTSTRTGSNEICAAFFNNHSPTYLTITSLFPARYLSTHLESMLLYPPVL